MKKAATSRVMIKLMSNVIWAMVVSDCTRPGSRQVSFEVASSSFVMTRSRSEFAEKIEISHFRIKEGQGKATEMLEHLLKIAMITTATRYRSCSTMKR